MKLSSYYHILATFNGEEKNQLSNFISNVEVANTNRVHCICAFTYQRGGQHVSNVSWGPQQRKYQTVHVKIALSSSTLTSLSSYTPGIVSDKAIPKVKKKKIKISYFLKFI
ncbi:hypothetical protein RIR_jg6921.t1 [Rhizophagus irregularis DAOM 181602=DAOM 197198]|uniref:Uncharacterized protein n=1 Tax=Rhizophagus irregularis (strain DAOM 181602 / DAOM 197198 / MUCL 43194) TaxID=747089 RepID=U9TXS2_RHIID|nr:hypothetical protein RIR_jg6921.t1 [Rhizophagus irregularis DAOM 181602=DAOM 197198]